MKKQQSFFRKNAVHPWWTMRLSLFFFVLAILFGSALITAALIFILYLAIPYLSGNPYLWVTFTAIGVLFLIAAFAAYFLSKSWLKSTSTITKALEEVAHGNFNVYVDPADHKGEFGELIRVFNEMASDLSHLEVFRNDFINYFSHEFKTPIVSIQGFAKQLENPNLTEEERLEYSQIIVRECTRLSSLSSDILLLSRLENQEIITDKTTFSVDEQIRHTLVLLEKEWSPKNINLDLDLAPANITTNEEILSVVWRNLLSNAIKFTPNGGTIKVKLTSDGSVIQAMIKDNGIGMNEQTLKHIYDKFYQADSSHKTKGNGLGLALVKRIVSLMQGAIGVESKEKAGTSFIVYLPVQ